MANLIDDNIESMTFSTAETDETIDAEIASTEGETAIADLPEEEKPKMQLDMYALNKSFFQSKKPLSKSKKREGFQAVARAVRTNPRATHYMLLNNENRYYTVFQLNENSNENVADVLQECLENIGEIKAINEKDDGAFEFWVSTETESAAYLFFDYTFGVIEVATK